MDADGKLIPITEDDQGEGFKDPLEQVVIMEDKRRDKIRQLKVQRKKERKLRKMGLR